MTIAGTFVAIFEFIRANWQIILGSVLAAVLPVAVLGFIFVGPLTQIFADQNVAQQPNPFVMMQAMLSLWLMVIVATWLVNAAVMLSWRHGLTDGAEPVSSNVGWSMAAGGLSMIAWYAISTAASMALYMMVILIALVVVGIFAAAGVSATDFAPSADNAGLGVGIIVAMIIFYVIVIVATYWLQARFSVAGPIMAARRTINPIDGYLESWKKTKSSQWTIVGLYFVQLAIVVACVAAWTLLAVGLIATAASNDGAKWLALGLGMVAGAAVFIPLLLLAVATPPAIYRQIAMEPDPGKDAFI